MNNKALSPGKILAWNFIIPKILGGPNWRNLIYRKWQTVSAELSWSHDTLRLSLSDDFARSFYEKQCIAEKWAVRELKRQIQSSLFQRIALSKDQKGILQLAKEGHVIESNKDIVKDPYVLEFLARDIPG